MAEDKKSEWASEWIASEAKAIGGGWAMQVGIIRDAQGKHKLRVIRGKVQLQGGISQAQKFNLNPKDWPWLREQLDKYVAQMQTMGATAEETGGE